MKPKVLIYDIETKPVKVWVWGSGKQYITHDKIVEGERFDIICICYKWVGEKKVHSLDWGKKQDSSEMIRRFSKLIDQADVAIGHNGDRFDLRQINSQALLHGLPPINWPTTEDTLKAIRRKFYLTSYRLDYLAKLLTGRGKEDTGGFQTWVDIVDKKCPKAMARMIKYCKRDVQALEEVWLKVAPYIEPKAHRGQILGNGKESCPSCGSLNIHKYGILTSRAGRYQKYKCTDCGHIHKSTQQLKEPK